MTSRRFKDSDDDDDNDNKSQHRNYISRDNDYNISQERSQSKKHTPCRHGDRCYTANCPYKHPPGWHPCRDNIYCKDFDCTANHSPNRTERCKYGRECRTKPNCPYLHPKSNQSKHVHHDDDDDGKYRTHKHHSPERFETDSKTQHRHFQPDDDDDDEDVGQYSKNRSSKHDSSQQQQQQRSQHKSIETRMVERRQAQLPIFPSYLEFCRRLLKERMVVVIAETGSGKSTQLVQYASECCPNTLVVCVQPYASTAITLARRVAEEYDGTLEGNSVGYQVGYSSERNNGCVPGTDILFMTNAALIYEFQSDPNLSRIGVLIIDEVHQRSLNTDLIISIAKRLLMKRAEKFFVVLALTTGDSTPLLKFFDRSSSSLLSIKDRQHSVVVENIPPPKDCSDAKFIELHVIPTLHRFYPEFTKHILVFLPNQREIEKALQIFNNNIPKGCIALSLYESLSSEEQNNILNIDDQQSNKRMVVFCTSIAETSVVIKNVQLVIDTGFERQFRFDKQRHTNITETVRISRFSADKRRDLVVRAKRGRCIRLYNDNELTENIEPEIRRSSLELVRLQLKRANLDIQTFSFITKPDAVLLHNSLEFLQNLMCLDKEEKITKRGELFAELSINPRLSALMVNIYTEQREGQRLLPLIATIVAIVSTPDSIFAINNMDNHLNDPDHHSETDASGKYNSDLLFLCNVFNAWRAVGILNQNTKKCITCSKIPKHQSNICHVCRAHHSFTHGLNNQVLQFIESSIDFYLKTITNPRWKLPSSDNTKNKQLNDGEIIGEYLRKFFPGQLGHLLVPHIPDEGARLIAIDRRASIVSQSIYVQRSHDQANQYFVAMSIIRLPSGRYVLDHLHQVPGHNLPASYLEKLLVRDNIGWSISNEVRTYFNTVRSESWTRWIVHEYDRLSRQLTIWGLPADKSQVEKTLQPILANTHLKKVECGAIRATFQNGLICSGVEIMENTLRLNLQRVPCRTYDKLLIWLKTKLNINGHDIRENNFQENSTQSNNDSDDDDDAYEATPFYIVLKSMDAFQRATANLLAHHVCPQEALSSSTTGTHMNERDAWGRQLVLTIPTGHTYITAKELLDRLIPHAVDCRQFGKRGIKTLPGVQLINLPRDADESFIRQILQSINPVKISLRQTHKDGTGSSSAHIFFADNQQRQQTTTKLQSDFCQKPITITVRQHVTHQLIQKQVTPTISDLSGKDAIPLTFLITAVNRDSATELYKDIIPKLDTAWQIDSTAIVTVTHPHLYPDFDALIQQIAKQFEIEIQKQPIHKKQKSGENPVRCFFNHGTPQKTALAAAMLAQSTAPIIIKINNERQKQLFEELFCLGKLQKWASELKLEVIRKERSSIWIEIRGPQVQQGQLMRLIGDYSDTFDKRFRILELNSTVANFFGRKKLADSQLQVVADNFSDRGCHINYIPKIKSITIYIQPSAQLSYFDACEAEVKKVLRKLSVDGNIIRDKQKCVFCGEISYSTNTLRLCGHAYCRCAASHLANTMPLQCHEATCKMNIDMEDLFEIFPEREEFNRICKISIQTYLEQNSSTYDQRFCPNPTCTGLVKKSRNYQLCLACGHSVCPSCVLMDDDPHQGRTCAERDMFQKMGDFLPTLFKAAEKFARDNWLPPPQTPPIIRVDYNMDLANDCPSMQRFYKGVQALGHPSPPDMSRGFFSFHGTAPAGIKPICTEGFDPKRRAGQAYGPGEYFGVTSAVSHGYSVKGNTTGPYSMIIAFLLNCPQLSTRPGFCHVLNNPVDWSHAFVVPVVVVSYGTQSTCDSPLK